MKKYIDSCGGGRIKKLLNNVMRLQKKNVEKLGRYGFVKN